MCHSVEGGGVEEEWQHHTFQSEIAKETDAGWGGSGFASDI